METRFHSVHARSSAESFQKKVLLKDALIVNIFCLSTALGIIAFLGGQGTIGMSSFTSSALGYTSLSGIGVAFFSYNISRCVSYFGRKNNGWEPSQPPSQYTLEGAQEFPKSHRILPPNLDGDQESIRISSPNLDESQDSQEPVGRSSRERRRVRAVNRDHGFSGRHRISTLDLEPPQPTRHHTNSLALPARSASVLSPRSQRTTHARSHANTILSSSQTLTAKNRVDRDRERTLVSFPAAQDRSRVTDSDSDDVSEKDKHKPLHVSILSDRELSDEGGVIKDRGHRLSDVADERSEGSQSSSPDIGEDDTAPTTAGSENPDVHLWTRNSMGRGGVVVPQDHRPPHVDAGKRFGVSRSSSLDIGEDATVPTHALGHPASLLTMDGARAIHAQPFVDQGRLYGELMARKRNVTIQGHESPGVDAEDGFPGSQSSPSDVGQDATGQTVDDSKGL